MKKLTRKEIEKMVMEKSGIIDFGKVSYNFLEIFHTTHLFRKDEEAGNIEINKEEYEQEKSLDRYNIYATNYKKYGYTKKEIEKLKEIDANYTIFMFSCRDCIEICLFNSKNEILYLSLSEFAAYSDVVLNLDKEENMKDYCDETCEKIEPTEESMNYLLQGYFPYPYWTFDNI